MIREQYCVECGEDVDPWLFGAPDRLYADCPQCGMDVLAVEGDEEPRVSTVGSWGLVEEPPSG